MTDTYFANRARQVLTDMGAPDADPSELAQWAEEHRPTGDTMPLAAIVADDGTVIATTERVDINPELSARYVREVYIEAPAHVAREVEDMAVVELSRIIGKKCAAIPQGVVCTGAGEPAAR